jgi:chaperone BCS1
MKNLERLYRPIGTVVLGKEQKIAILLDINEYLNLVTVRWYANKGIPYWRGYLFYRLPRIGKISLTFILTGVFGLDIYVVLLLELSLIEEDLGMLFINLLTWCIVLFEDIDIIGLKREPTDVEEKDEIKKGISLSGLLNIIDSKPPLLIIPILSKTKYLINPKG